MLSTARDHHWQASGVALGAGLGIFAWLIWNIIVRSRVGVWGEGIDDVVKAVADSGYDVVLRLKDGSRVRPLALLGTPLGNVVFGGRHQRGAAASLEIQRERRSGDEEAHRIRSFELRWVSLLVIVAIVVGLGFTPTN